MFKIGDKVRILVTHANAASVYKNDIGIINEVKIESYLVEMEDHNSWFISEKYLELVPSHSQKNIDPIIPPHYSSSKFEAIEIIEDYNLGFNLGNVIKYVLRAGKKDPSKTLEDLKKAKYYINREIKKLDTK